MTWNFNCSQFLVSGRVPSRWYERERPVNYTSEAEWRVTGKGLAQGKIKHNFWLVDHLYLSQIEADWKGMTHVIGLDWEQLLSFPLRWLRSVRERRKQTSSRVQRAAILLLALCGTYSREAKNLLNCRPRNLSGNKETHARSFFSYSSVFFRVKNITVFPIQILIFDCRVFVYGDV